MSRFICYYAECHYAECRYAKCRGAISKMLNFCAHFTVVFHPLKRAELGGGQKVTVSREKTINIHTHIWSVHVCSYNIKQGKLAEREGSVRLSSSLR